MLAPLGPLLLLACSWLTPQAPPEAPKLQQPKPAAVPDPEATADGRASYLGREVAHTMHWTGAPWLLRATREDEENGALLQQWLAVQPGQVVCDLGCGNGYHTLPMARAVGARGKVYAVDIQREMLQLLAMRSKQAQLDNVELIEGAFDDPKLPKNSCDLVLLVDVYHELSHPVRVLGHVREALRPGGRVVLVEFRAEDPEVPIKQEHKMTKAQTVAELAENGFALADSFDGLPWQHALSFTRTEETSPRAAARAVVHAFLRELARGDLRTVAPFFAARVATSRDVTVPSAELVASLAAALASDANPTPTGTRFVLRESNWSGAPDGCIAADLQLPPGATAWQGRTRLEIARDREGCLRIYGFRSVEAAERPFVAMHTGTGNAPFAEQAALVHSFGYAGIAGSVTDIGALRQACEAHRTDAFSAYAVLDLSSDRIDTQEIRAAMAALAGGPGTIWLALQHRGLTARDPKGDEVAATALSPLLAVSKLTGVAIALYPHHGFWLETAEDALRLCERISDPALGVCFNLCHFLRCTPNGDADAILRRCGTRLMAVTVNGASVKGTDWTELIQPLDRGDYDHKALLRTLDAIGYRGPVGLQAFGIALPPREHLSRSMAAWRSLQTK